MQPKKSAVKYRTFLLYRPTLLLLLILGGCASQPTLTQIAAFGVATESLAENAEKGYALVDEKVVQRNLYFLANDTSSGPTDKDFEGLVGAQGLSKEQAKALAARMEALNRLGTYASGLNKLATANFQEDIDDAALRLNGALTGLVESHKELSDSSESIMNQQSIGLVASAINAIGRTIVEKKRRDAIRTVIVEANPAVQSVAELIGKELAEKGGAGDAAAKAVRTSEGILKLQYNKDRKSPQSTFDERLAKLERIQQIHQDAEDTEGFFLAVGQAANQVAITHGILLSEVKKDKFTSAEIAKSIGELVNQAKAVRAFYQDLQE